MFYQLIFPKGLIFRKCRFLNSVRKKHKPDHWSVLKKKVHPIDKALDHFDDFYAQVFGKGWPEIRTGLLGKQKYIALINNYSDADEICKKLELIGALNVRKLFQLEKKNIEERYSQSKRLRNLIKIWKTDKEINHNLSVQNDDEITEMQEKYDSLSLEKSMEKAQIESDRMLDPKHFSSAELLHEFIPATEIKGREDFLPESTYYSYYDENTDLTVKIEREFDLHFPENLNIYTYEIENTSNFDSPRKGSTGVLNYYLMDGGSLLPVLALDLKPDNTFLDMCAAPGGKSLLALQTLYPSSITSNDCSVSRVNRIYSVFKQFLFDFDQKFLKTGRIVVTQGDGRFIHHNNTFDRILVDVPCTVDRHSLRENDNNIFKPSRVKERLKLPELQSDLLFNALKLVNENGIVVYSTCSLSPIQNDGVVHMALRKLYEQTDKQFVIKDLSPALLQARSVYKIANPKLMKYGQLVLPCSAQNFGPTYFCKLKRIK